jgi:hypothetical protein
VAERHRFFVLAVGIYLLLRWSREARALRLALGILRSASARSSPGNWAF